MNFIRSLKNHSSHHFRMCACHLADDQLRNAVQKVSYGGYGRKLPQGFIIPHQVARCPAASGHLKCQKYLPRFLSKKSSTAPPYDMVVVMHIDLFYLHFFEGTHECMGNS